LCAISFSTKGNAQIYAETLHPDADFGIKVGANFQQIVGSPFIPAYNTGFAGGLFWGKNWDKIGFHIEALVNNGSYNTEHPVSYGLFHEKGTDSTNKGKFSALYLSIPVLAEIKLKKKIFFEIGPQYNYMLSFTDNNGAYTKEFKNDKILKSGEVCIDLGINANLPYGFNLGFRYVKGLTNVNNSTYYRANDAWQINDAQILLSYKIR